MLSEIQEFITTHYVDPIVTDSGYNIVNTLTWAMVLVLCVYGLHSLKVFKRLGVTIDQHFVMGVVCYVLFGSSLRVLKDAEVFAPPLKYIFVTPIIYFVVFAVTMASLILSICIYKERYYISFAVIGLGLTSVNICVLLWSKGIAHHGEALLIVALAIVITALIYVGAGFAKIEFLRGRFNIAILGAHLLDATSTTIAIDFLTGYSGKHVVENYLIDLTGTGAAMYPLKLFLLIPMLYLIDSEFDEAELRDLLKLVVLILGLAPGCRNTILILFGAGG
ncbi:MAG: hypothetical protein C4B59_02990 [Candidatus Methanogaster sp.]|uniref:Uncharacterized protein n=1 Tax=Candidatus Methanogaster sp. TaxID=3386292 RepID=A0AC61L4T7_9EURY|nr:MAG: hypothetical protein C4B59_02990 [ANME-2 cluster archaeon]